MTKSRWFSVFTTLVALLLVVSLAGCGGAKQEGQKGGEQKSEVKKQFLTIGTGGSGGVWYVIGAGMADILNKKVPGWKVNAESTGAAIENCRLVGKGNMEFAVGSPETTRRAIAGEEDFVNDKYPNLRAVMGGHKMYFQVVARGNLGVKSFRDLDGKKVAIGAPGQAGANIGVWLAKKAGIKIIEQKLSFAEGASAMKDGTVDAAFVYSGAPVSAIVEMTNTMNVTLVPIDVDLMEAIRKEYAPDQMKDVIKAGIYKGQDKDINTISSATILITNDKVPDDTVFTLIKTLYDNNADLAAIHTAGKEWGPKDALNGLIGDDGKPVIPFHPAAEKYLKEKGILK